MALEIGLFLFLACFSFYNQDNVRKRRKLFLGATFHFHISKFVIFVGICAVGI